MSGTASFLILAICLISGQTVSAYNPVAFHANRGSPLTVTDQTKEHIVVYDSVKLNVGLAYNSVKGKFECPEAGIYSFSWTSDVPQGKQFETSFILKHKNSQLGTKITGNRASAIGVSDSVQSTKNVVVDMKKGDMAFIKTIRNAADVLHGDVNSFSSFSGFKVL
ncbi:complement C1q-like protein 4 [Mytilus edulis]|uniref:complement C1q-like protein 4 n=1 Tax=Mytilus edulis TaxID=6550 RepID=UPI0039EFFF7B